MATSAVSAGEPSPSIDLAVTNDDVDVLSRNISLPRSGHRLKPLVKHVNG